MTTATKEEFLDWLNHPVTQAVRKEQTERIEYYTQELSLNAGRDPIQDRYYTGYIAALRDTLDVALEEPISD